MIRKLRIKLILASMLSLLFVLAVILGVAGVLNYRKIVMDADSILTILQDNDGSFPVLTPPDNDLFIADERPRQEHRFSPELPYESRYFSVLFTESDEILSVNTGKIAAVDTETAIDYAQSVMNSGRSRGFINDYRYIVYMI